MGNPQSAELHEVPDIPVINYTEPGLYENESVLLSNLSRQGYKCFYFQFPDGSLTPVIIDYDSVLESLTPNTNAYRLDPKQLQGLKSMKTVEGDFMLFNEGAF